jgi:hypothetical protein
MSAPTKIRTRYHRRCRESKVRTLSIEDAYTREMLAIEVDTSLPSGRVVRVLEKLRQHRALPSGSSSTMARNSRSVPDRKRELEHRSWSY